MNRKILFIASHRKDRAPGQRFRFEQYFEWLNQNGFHCELSFLFGEKEDAILYGKGKYWKKIWIGCSAILRRWKDVRKRNDFDIIFIFREAFITGSIFFEKQFRKSRAKLIYDFDDAIWIDVISSSNRSFAWLKNAEKTAQIIKMVDLVFAGNMFLANYSLKYNSKVVVIPTTINTDEYKPRYSTDKEKVVIGWSGSKSTIEHFKHAIPALIFVKKRYGSKVEIRVIGDENFKHEELQIKGYAWKLETELRDLQCFDIGIMPLPNNEWTKGKCGLKGLQYMSLEIPTVMSPVGVNNEIITDGINGFLANQTDEWVSKLSLLIENHNLRIEIGRAGRKTVVEKYSVSSQQVNYLNQFNLILSQ